MGDVAFLDLIERPVRGRCQTERLGLCYVRVLSQLYLPPSYAFPVGIADVAYHSLRASGFRGSLPSSAGGSAAIHREQSRAYTPGPYSGREELLHVFDETIIATGESTDCSGWSANSYELLFVEIRTVALTRFDRVL